MLFLWLSGRPAAIALKWFPDDSAYSDSSYVSAALSQPGWRSALFLDPENFYCLRNKLLKSPSAVKCPTVAGSPSEKERAAGAAGSGNDLFSWETDVLQNSQASHFRHGQTHRGNRNMKYSHWILWWSFKPLKQLDFTSFLHRCWNNAPIYRNAVASSLRSVICICCMQIKKKKTPQIYKCQQLKCLFNIIVV